MEHLVLVVAMIGVLGVGAQWLAWRFNLPAIVLMAAAGLAARPVFASLLPAHSAHGPVMETIFGDFYQPLIGMAVAVILFEGGLSLDFSEIRELTKGVRRLVFPGVVFAWTFGALATHYCAGLDWDIAILFAAIMVVTGPTVITPLLRQARLRQRPATLLKWEGIINDPIGALLAVLAYETIALEGEPTSQIIGALLIAAILSAALGFVLGRMVAAIFRRGWVPEYLKPPVLLVVVLACFEGANFFENEAGLLAVTALGVTIANSRIASINELRIFKENMAVLLVSGVFIILTANITGEALSALDWRSALYVGAMLFAVRPLSVFLSTIGSGLPWRERLLVAWIAPRGIVAVAISSFLGAALVASGREGGAELLPLAFAVVAATVILHGFTISPLSKALGLATRERPGVLIVGATPFSVALAAKLKEMEIPVMVADASWRRLRPARLANVETYYGEILSEVTEHHLDFNRFGYLLALSGNEAYNALVCTDLAPELGRAAIYQVSDRGKDDESRQALSFTLQGRTFLSSGATFDELLRRHYAGWTFQKTRLSEKFTPEQYRAELDPQTEIVLLQRKGALFFSSQERPLEPQAGDIVLAFAPPATDTRKEPRPGASDALKEAINSH